MTKAERDELRRSIIRFQELSTPPKLMELLLLVAELEKRVPAIPGRVADYGVSIDDLRIEHDGKHRV
jgi:hypothetical protein